MKKYIYIIWTIIISSFLHWGVLYAAEPRECGTGEYCSIKNETRPEIDIYVENNTRVVRNITAIARANGKTKADPDEDPTKFSEYLVGQVNKTVEWAGQHNLFEFYVTSAFESSIPEPIYRDFQKIQDEWHRIQKLINMISDRGYIDIIVTNDQICNGVNGNCEIRGEAIEWSLWTILWLLQDNNDNIKRTFLLAATAEEKRNTKYEEIFLVPEIGTGSPWELFTQMIETYYWADAVAECNQCSGGNFAEIKESINSISQTLQWQTDAYDNWKDAWNLLIGWVEDERKRKNERQLLEKELSRQWIQHESAQIILKNLDDYNNPKSDNSSAWFTWGNNFISNSYNAFVNDTTNDLNEYDATLDALFNESAEDPDVNLQSEFVTIDEFKTGNKKIDASIQISQDVERLYLQQLEHAQKDDSYSTKLVWRIIDTHNNINEAIRILDETRVIAEEVCDSQAAGLGTCSFWNHK